MAEETKTQPAVQSFPEGFVIRTKEGKLRIVKDGRLVDYFETSAAPSTTPPAQQPVTPRYMPQQPPSPRAPEPTMPAVSPRPQPRPLPPQRTSGQTAPPQQPQIPQAPPVVPQSQKPIQLPPELQPQKPFATTPKPAFFIDAEDEQDAAEHQDKISEFQQGRLTESDIVSVIAGIVARNAVNFEDEVMQKRFYNIVRSRILEIRNMMETEDALTRPSKVGGMGFESGLVRRLVVDIEDEAGKLAERGAIADLKRQLAESAKKAPVQPYAPHIPMHPPQVSSRTMESAARKDLPPSQPPQPAVPQSSLVRPTPVGAQPRPTPATIPAPAVSLPPVQPASVAPPPVMKPPLAPEAQPSQPSPIQPPQPTIPRVAAAPEPSVRIPVTVEPQLQKISRPQPSQNRPQVSDIAVAPQRRVIGPVDELAELAAEDFRRFGSSADDGKKKILEKISLLEEESYAKRSQGIKAWRRSPLFQLYLAIGRQSIESGSSVKDVIAKRATEHQDTLTLDEFSAIADLNALIRQ